MTAKALLTGGNGNLARLVSDQLLAAGDEVVKFDLPGTEPDELRDGEHCVSGDVRDTALLEKTIRTHRPSIIYHFASLLSGSSEADLAAAWEINASASFRLLHLAVTEGVETVLFASTAASYGPDLSDPLPEDAQQWPHTLYGATKIAVERAGVYFKVKHGLDFRCVRFPLVVSPFAPPSAVTAYPSHAFKAALRGERFSYPVSPEVGMSSIFIEDVIDGTVQFARADRARLQQHAYNLHAYFVSAEQVTQTIRERIPEFECSYQPQAAVEALLGGWPDVILDDAARSHWGWSPRYDFQKSAERMFELLG